LWFDGERKQREFWIAQNSLPTPQTTQTYTFGSIDQCFDSATVSNTLVSQVPNASYLTGNVLPTAPVHVNTEPFLPEADLALYPRKKHRRQDTSQKFAGIEQTPQRTKRWSPLKRRQLRRQRSDNHDNAAGNGTFGCPTCGVMSKTEAAWTSHQKRCHFPRIVWVCGVAEGKACKIPPSKRKDNFRSHLAGSHGFPVDKLEGEIKRRAVRVTGLFHEICGFCKQGLGSWGASMQHIWDHIEAGADVSEWTHACETDHELQVGVHYLQSSRNSQTIGDGFDKDDNNDDDPSSGGSSGKDSHFGSFSGFDNFDNFDFDSTFDGGLYDGGGQSDCYGSQAPHKYQYQMTLSNSIFDNTTGSLSDNYAAVQKKSQRSFVFVKTLGRGGFGRVDEVTCMDLPQNFAPKILRRSVPGTNAASAVATFKNEVEILQTLLHPHVVRFVGSHMFGNAFSILMHPVVEGTLATYLLQSELKSHRNFGAISKAARPMDHLWTLMGCLASAVSYIHSVNIVHGDIKPENILTNGTRILLTDFGSAKKLSDVNRALEPTCTLSPEFSAPETIRSGHKDSSGDVWSFGCVLTLVATHSAGRNLDDFDRFRLSGGSNKSFHSSLKRTLEWLALLEISEQLFQTPEFDRRTLIRMIHQMISEEPRTRPRAQEVWNSLPKDQNCQCNSQSSQSASGTPAGMSNAVVSGDHTEDLLRQRLSEIVVNSQDTILQRYQSTSSTEGTDNNTVQATASPRSSSLMETS
jgi:serine/threonine protein kinase